MSLNTTPHRTSPKKTPSFSVSCASLEDTFSVAHIFSEHLCEADIIYLQGDLGAGKTTFVQGIAQELGITEPVTSPTFNLMFQYVIPAERKGFSELYHFDLYRIHDQEELGESGLLDVAGYEGVTFIEWGEPYKHLLGSEYFEIAFNRDESHPDKRVLRFSATGTSQQGRLAAFRCAIADDD